MQPQCVQLEADYVPSFVTSPVNSEKLGQCVNHVNDFDCVKQKQWVYIHILGFSFACNFTKDVSRNFIPSVFILYTCIRAFKDCCSSKLALIYAGKCL